MDSEPKCPPHRSSLWRPWGLLVLGVCLVLGAAFLARRLEIGPKLDLDLRGARIRGSIEPNGPGGYRIRYEHPSGTIYSRTCERGLGMQRIRQRVEMDMVYDPQRPGRFQPAGQSYLPAALAGAPFLCGMACLFRARRMFLETVRGGRGTVRSDRSS